MSGKRHQRTLLGFFEKKKNDESSPTAGEAVGIEANSPEGNQVENTPMSEESTRSETSTFINDIGYQLSKGKRPDDETIHELLINHWKPPVNYQLPFSEHVKGGKTEKRYLKHSHLQSYPWVVLSVKDRGLYCLYCPFFASEIVANQKRIRLDKLVRAPLTTFAKLLGKDGHLDNHSNAYYHLAAMEKAKFFMESFKESTSRIDNIIHSNRHKQVAENRARLSRIITAVVYHGKQNLALRGHRDSGRVELSVCSSEEPPKNEGNFRETLRLMVDSGDDILKKHLESASSNAMYTSSSIQNEIIQCIGEEIQQRIFQKIRSCGPYSILFDETTDLSHTNVMTFVVRYVDASDGRKMIREDFVDFMDTYGALATQNAEAGIPADVETVLTGKALGSLVVAKMKHYEFDFQFCVGIATDGCSVMVSETVGAVTTIKKEAKHAEHCHCYSHDLSLSLQKSSNSQEARNTMGIIQRVISFFTQSAKRNQVLVRVTGGQLKALCITRWVEKHRSISEFADKFPSIVRALEEIQLWRESKSSSKAHLLLCAVRNFEFMVTLNILNDLLSSVAPLSAALQNKQLDISLADELVQDTIVVLRAKRENADTRFAEIYASTTATAVDLELPQTMPRTVNRQVHRSNYRMSSPEENYRVAVYIPVIDDIIQDLENRFRIDANHVTSHLASLMPKMVVNLTEPNVRQLVKTLLARYHSLATSSVETHFTNEVLLWQQRWIRDEKRPSDVLESLDTADSDIYPSVHFFLKVFAVMPVSVASAERSFSTLRRLKTFLRTTMTEERSTGLTLMHIHRDSDLDMESIINRFGNKQSRRLSFIW